jgi:hypothetical protein
LQLCNGAKRLHFDEMMEWWCLPFTTPKY